MRKRLATPISRETALALRAGDLVSLSGVVVTARDTAHKYLVEQLSRQAIAKSEIQIVEQLRATLQDGVIYHCGPVVRRASSGWEFVSAGPTTSTREEEYEDRVMEHFSVRAIIGKGGMGPRTMMACVRLGAVYLHAIGGAAALIAQNVVEVLSVHKLEFGVPEALWVIRVADLELLVTIDAHGNNLHQEVETHSRARLAQLLS